ncbi:hypothetical protein C0993_003913 [Termitomyces sp. T159_Od127]|nr:hypothetical protein C0993_003913 [Termitomyces sp. T159_Od127]
MIRPPAPSDPALLAKEVADIQSSHVQLQALLTQLIAKVDAHTTASLAPAPLPSAVPVTGSFVPPTISSGVTTVLAVIILHELKAADLHKLDPTNCDKETAYTFNGSTNQFEVSNHTAREYKTPFSVLIPLQTYF